MLKAIPYLLNLIFVGLVAYFIVKTNSDKSPILFMLFYPAILVLNLITLIVFIILKNKVFTGIIKNNILLLLLLIIPMFILMSTI